MTEDDWDQLANLIWVEDGCLIVDSRFDKEFAHLREEEDDILDIITDNIVVIEDGVLDEEAEEEIDWDAVRSEYEDGVI